MDLIQEILKIKKLKGLSWEDLSVNLPINGNSLRMAFNRNRVDAIYLNEICNTLDLQNTQTEQGSNKKEKVIKNYIAEDVDNIISNPNTSYNNEIVIFLRDKIKLLEAQIVLLEENKAFQQEKILALERCVKCFQEEIKKLNNEIESSKK